MPAIQRQITITSLGKYLTLLILGSLTACSLFPSVFSYSIQILDRNSTRPIPNAKITLSVPNKAPLSVFTDNDGFTRVDIEEPYVGQHGVLRVDATGYQSYIKNIDVTRDALPQVIQLEQSNTVSGPSPTTAITESPPVPTLSALTSTSISSLSESTNTPSAITPSVAPTAGATITPLKAIHAALLKTLRGHEGAVWGVAFAPDNKTVASASYDKTLRRWSVASGETVDIFEQTGGGLLGSDTRPAIGVAYGPEGAVIAGTYQNGTIQIFQIADGKQIRTLTGHTSAALSVAWSPDGALIASGGADGTVRLWDATHEREPEVLRGHVGVVTHVAFSPDSSMLASVSYDGTVRVWQTSDGHQLHKLAAGIGAAGVAWSPDGKILVSAGNEQKIRIWQVQSERLLRTIDLDNTVAFSVAISPDGQIIAAGCTDGKIRLWSLLTGESLATLEGHEKAATSVAWSPDGTMLVSGSEDTTVRLWRIQP